MTPLIHSTYKYTAAGLLALLLFSASGCEKPATAEAVTATDPDKVRVYEIWEPEPAPNRGHNFEARTRGRAYPYDFDWDHWSYPLGNGNLGANVFGRYDTERVQLTEKPFSTAVLTTGAR